ncbi:hypothetical protein PN462_23215 [Spirulina sp. CS-785/01]|uniref:hypothetical protein n=1 Tax=Spirulina sp. CS-785/01 TaxID=3021716 RepID=UPI00232CB3A0|nr:hypothetical protein [Spirulina sp. CS-785/01]MDB9316040.1 hypothetical protein [Spirulina sp. CS-785/01]
MKLCKRFSLVNAVSGLAGVLKMASTSGNALQQPSLQEKTFEAGWEKFLQSKDKWLEKVRQSLRSILSQRVQAGLKISQQMISQYEEILEQIARSQQATPEQRETDQVWINQKRQQLEAIQQEIATTLN